MAGASKRSEYMQKIKSNQSHEHYVEKGYVMVGSARVEIRRDRVNRDFIYEYVVEDEVPVTFNESTLSDEFVIQMRKYISRYGAPKLSRVAFFGTRADDYTSGRFFDDHYDILKGSVFYSRDVPRFAFNWQGKQSLTWFTRLGHQSQTVFEIAQSSSPSTPPPKFRLGEQVVFHTSADEYVQNPELQHEVIEQISYEECSNDDQKWYLMANKSRLRDTDWLYRVRGVNYYFREEDLAGFFDMSVNTEFLRSVGYRTSAGQQMCEVFHAQDESFEALLKNPKIQELVQQTDLEIIKNLQLFDGITCGVERINGSGANWYKLKFARILPMIGYKKTPQSLSIKIAGCTEFYYDIFAFDDMIEAVHDGSNWTVNTPRDTEMMICLDMALSDTGLTYIQLKSGFDDISSFKKCIPFGLYDDKISKNWLEEHDMRGSANESVTIQNSEMHAAVMPALFYEISYLHSIEKRMVQIDTRKNLRRAKQQLTVITKQQQIKSIVENGLEETIATVHDQPLQVGGLEHVVDRNKQSPQGNWNT